MSKYSDFFVKAILLVTTITLISTFTLTSTVLPQMTYAQGGGMQMSSSDTSGMQMSSSDNTDTDSDYPRDSFTATGEISSLIITVPEEGFDISTAFKVILTGEWNLNVKDGNVANFAANFIASPIDGSRPHTHQIMNFRSNNDDAIVLLQGNNASINGKVDIKINGVNVWEGADIEIQILNGSTITIDPDDADTDGHFGDQTVNGIVTRIIS
ncbi:MAG TPA: hypothetical protein VH415_02245 [Nitrososphaeraceae archaeon]